MLSLILVCLLAAAYFYLPYYLEARIIPQLVAETGVSNFSINVRNIGLFHADLGTLRVGPQDNPDVEVKSVQIDYSPLSLYQRKIKKVAMTGIDLHWRLADDRLELQGIDIEKMMAGEHKQTSTAPNFSDTGPPIIFEMVEISDSRVKISANDQIYWIPFEIDMVPQDSEYDRLDLTSPNRD